MADPLTPILNNKKNHKINNDPREHTASNEKGAYKPVCLLWCLFFYPLQNHVTFRRTVFEFILSESCDGC